MTIENKAITVTLSEREIDRLISALFICSDLADKLARAAKAEGRERERQAREDSANECLDLIEKLYLHLRGERLWGLKISESGYNHPPQQMSEP